MSFVYSYGTLHCPHSSAHSVTLASWPVRNECDTAVSESSEVFHMGSRSVVVMSSSARSISASHRLHNPSTLPVVLSSFELASYGR